MDTKDIKDALDMLVSNSDSEKDRKRTEIFLKWIFDKTHYFVQEKSGFIVESKNLPKKITEQTYTYSNIKSIIDKHYRKENNLYILNNLNVDKNDSISLYKNLVLIKRNIVWIEFGCNIGCEFGGKHPAVILKNLGDVLIVCPISSDNGKLRQKMTAIELAETEIYNMPSQRKRFTDITRLIPISIMRVDTNSSPGSMKSNKFKEILDKLKVFYK